ncbi:MAG: GAF domain-containing protein, partial [Bacillota bacterium]
MNKKQGYNREISAEIKDKWQSIVDIIVKTAGSSDALITRLDSPYLEVFKTSDNLENNIVEGQRNKLSGTYCEQVITSDKKLMVIDALKDEKWKDSLEIEAGFNAYLGYPLKWPDGKVFGTLCIHDKKAHEFSKQTQEIMLSFKELIESHLKIINNNLKMQRDNEIIKSQKNRLDWIIEGTDAGTWEWNVQTGETIFNDKWAEMLGYSLEEISPTTIETW